MLIIPVTRQISPARIWTPNIGKKADDSKSIPIPSTSSGICNMVLPSPSDPNHLLFTTFRMRGYYGVRALGSQPAGKEVLPAPISLRSSLVLQKQPGSNPIDKNLQRLASALQDRLRFDADSA